MDAKLTEPAVMKQTGVRHFFAAAGYSWGGFKRLIQESAFRHELIFFVAALAVVIGVGATAIEMVVTVVLFLALFAVEAMNTAIEEVIDRISPEISNVGKHAKDLGSFAVLCMLLACGLFLLFVVGKHLIFG